MPDTVGSWIGALVVVIAAGAVIGLMVRAWVRRWPKPRDWKQASRYSDAGDGGDGSGGA
jgi:hypothetical protein